MQREHMIDLYDAHIFSSYITMSDFIENDEEVFLSQLPYSIILDSIESQFETPSDTKKRDYVDLYFKRYKQIKDNSLDDDIIELDEERDDFIRTLSELFEYHYNIGLNILDETSDDEDIENTLIMAFRFFNNRIKKNFINIIFNYIDENKDELVSKYVKNKDITLASFKDMITDKIALTAISNVGYIVDDCIEDIRKISDLDTFFDLCDGKKPSVELEYVRACFDDMRLTGNFIASYTDKLDDDTISDIKTTVRKKLIKKYKNN